ncbi:unnamed protein product, partial [Allacma fusca]
MSTSDSSVSIPVNRPGISINTSVRNNLEFTPKLWPQLLAAFAANMGAFAFGTVISWSAVGFPRLEED